MSPEELQKNIALYYSKLPPKTQEMFSSMAWMEKLKEISLKFSLNDTQKETLGTETTLVLLGIIHVDEYMEILEKELSLPKETFDIIFSEINNSVINAIRPELISAFNSNIESLSEENGVKNIEVAADERLKKLSPEIQKVIAESKYQEALYNVGKNQGLNMEQLGALEKIVTNLVVGDIVPERFENSIVENLKLVPEKAKVLANELNEKIMKNIREKMKVGTTYALPQKLSSVVQMPKVETVHTLDNITKTAVPTAPTPSNTMPKVDPYRELPE